MAVEPGITPRGTMCRRRSQFPSLAAKATMTKSVPVLDVVLVLRPHAAYDL